MKAILTHEERRRQSERETQTYVEVDKQRMLCTDTLRLHAWEIIPYARININSELTSDSKLHTHSGTY